MQLLLSWYITIHFAQKDIFTNLGAIVAYSVCIFLFPLSHPQCPLLLEKQFPERLPCYTLVILSPFDGYNLKSIRDFLRVCRIQQPTSCKASQLQMISLISLACRKGSTDSLTKDLIRKDNDFAPEIRRFAWGLPIDSKADL